MIGRTNATIGSGKDSVSLKTKPNITYDGNWLSWHIELYGGVPYWEAWFLSSGVLTVNEACVADAWGIGGGEGVNWGVTSGSAMNAAAGRTNMIKNTPLSGSVAVTIGAGGSSHHYERVEAGGDTILGDVLICSGAPGVTSANGSSNSVTDSYKRYRFEDPDKANEAGENGVDTDGRIGQGGWLRIKRSLTPSSSYYDDGDGAQGDGFGGGGSYFGYACHGALVIRIPI